MQDILDRRFRYIRLQIPTSNIILWTSLTRQPMLSASFPDICGRPGDLSFFFKVIKLASNCFADRTVSSICTEETARHLYSGFVIGQRHYALCFLSQVQLAGHTTTESLCIMRRSQTRTCLQTCQLTSTARFHFYLLTNVITDRNWVHHCQQSSVIQVNWFLTDSHWWPSNFSGVLRFFWGFRARGKGSLLDSGCDWRFFVDV